MDTITKEERKTQWAKLHPKQHKAFYKLNRAFERAERNERRKKERLEFILLLLEHKTPLKEIAEKLKCTVNNIKYILKKAGRNISGAGKTAEDDDYSDLVDKKIIW